MRSRGGAGRRVDRRCLRVHGARRPPGKAGRHPQSAAGAAAGQGAGCAKGRTVCRRRPRSSRRRFEKSAGLRTEKRERWRGTGRSRDADEVHGACQRDRAPYCEGRRLRGAFCRAARRYSEPPRFFGREDGAGGDCAGAAAPRIAWAMTAPRSRLPQNPDGRNPPDQQLTDRRRLSPGNTSNNQKEPPAAKDFFFRQWAALLLKLLRFLGP